MCQTNSYYKKHHPNENCQEDFTDFRAMVLGRAQAAFLVTVVWGQIANVLIRKTQVATIFTWSRFFDNHVMNWSILSEIVIIIFLAYTPYVNEVFLMRAPSPRVASCAVWIIPFMLIWDEVRKYLIRKDRNGCVAKYTIN
jgi:hypothetical protein